jgi:hypothetical protein
MFLCFWQTVQMIRVTDFIHVCVTMADFYWWFCDWFWLTTGNLYDRFWLTTKNDSYDWFWLNTDDLHDWLWLTVLMIYIADFDWLLMILWLSLADFFLMIYVTDFDFSAGGTQLVLQQSHRISQMTREMCVTFSQCLTLFQQQDEVGALIQIIEGYELTFCDRFQPITLLPYETSGKCCNLHTHGALHYFLCNALVELFEFFNICTKEHFQCVLFYYAKMYHICTQFYNTCNKICTTGIWILLPSTKHSFIGISENNSVSNSCNFWHVFESH